VSERPRLVIRHVLNTFLLQENKVSTGGVQKTVGTFNVLLAIRASSVSDWVLDRIRSDMDKSKRQLSPDISIAARKAEMLRQVTSY